MMIRTIRQLKKEIDTFKATQSAMPYPKPTDIPMKKAGDLERMIILHTKLLRERDGIQIMAAKIDVRGTYREGIGYVPTQSTKGVSDIWITLRGGSRCIEIKWGRDKIGDDQIKFQQRQEFAGGTYDIVSTPEEWFSWVVEHVY